MKLEYVLDNGEKLIIPYKKMESYTYVGRSTISFQNKYSQPVLEELKEQLNSCRQLLDLEPENKWTLLTLSFFLYCIDANLYHKEIIKNLHTLINVDYQRAGYYNDLISTWSIEQQILLDYKNVNLNCKVEFDEKISTLSHLQYYSYCKNVDLSNQKLTSKVLPSLVKLQQCKDLDLSNNNIMSLNGFPLIKLSKLNLSGNELDQDEVESLRQLYTGTEIIF